MKRRKKALITGITGQDGAYLSEFLVGKGYEVFGMVRRSSLPNTGRIRHLCGGSSPGVNLLQGDLADSESIFRIVMEIRPDEIYNLGSQSHVGVSFKEPEYTADVSGIGTLRFLEAVRMFNLEKKTKFYQASTSELFGKVREIPQSEKTPFYPRSPYGVAKLFAYWTVVNYREAYGLFAANGILFNHESPLRGEEFVTRKITRGMTRVYLGLQDCLSLGNLDSKRDWGHARDYVKAMWLILRRKKPEDFVIATGRQHSVREFVEMSAKKMGIIIRWRGKGLKEVGIAYKARRPEIDISEKGRVKEGQVIVRIDPRFYRPSDVSTLLGNSKKARKLLGWKPEVSFGQLVEDMIVSDFELAEKEAREKSVL